MSKEKKTKEETKTLSFSFSLLNFFLSRSQDHVAALGGDRFCYFFGAELFSYFVCCFEMVVERERANGRRNEERKETLSLFLFCFLTSGSTARDLATTLASSGVANVTRASLICFLERGRRKSRLEIGATTTASVAFLLDRCLAFFPFLSILSLFFFREREQTIDIFDREASKEDERKRKRRTHYLKGLAASSMAIVVVGACSSSRSRSFSWSWTRSSSSTAAAIERSLRGTAVQREGNSTAPRGREKEEERKEQKGKASTRARERERAKGVKKKQKKQIESLVRLAVISDAARSLPSSSSLLPSGTRPRASFSSLFPRSLSLSKEKRRARQSRREVSDREEEHRFFSLFLLPLPCPSSASPSFPPVARETKQQPSWRSSPRNRPPRRPSSTPWTLPLTMSTPESRLRRITLPRARATSTRASRPCSASSSSTRSR